MAGEKPLPSGTLEQRLLHVKRKDPKSTASGIFLVAEQELLRKGQPKGSIEISSVLSLLETGKKISEVTDKGRTRPPQTPQEIEQATAVIQGIILAIASRSIDGQIDLLIPLNSNQEKLSQRLHNIGLYWLQITSPTRRHLNESNETISEVNEVFLDRLLAAGESGQEKIPIPTKDLRIPRPDLVANHEGKTAANEIVLFPSPAFVPAMANFILYHDLLFNRLGIFYDDRKTLKENIDKAFAVVENTVNRNDPQVIALEQQSRLEALTHIPSLVAEYLSILRGVEAALGSRERIAIVNPDRYEPSNIEAEDIMELVGYIQYNYRGVSIPTLVDQKGEYFLRDHFLQIGPFLFLTKQSFPQKKQSTTDTINAYISQLGEGGGVLAPIAQNKTKAILVGDFLSAGKAVREDITMLELSGYNIASIPPIRLSGQPANKRNIAYTHIDGHAPLVTAPDGKTYVLYAKSYVSQDNNTRARMQAAAQHIKAIPVEVNDDLLPHLGMNFVQFENGNILCARGGVSENDSYRMSALEQTLVSIIGKERLFLTSIPITLIPKLGAGSIHCMINTVDPSALALIQG